ncbi:unnamed protein product [Didymodactylos carnosus]|uniref:Uncharacterized protein n=1 Tax=Didymodactylos carnosus TaxID=1234261 RepID=A0A8S2FDP3_9BILA|nr:unnamed protein product [Didymodactylos carnosus]CAF4231068.1 unnamed protein product [Didymodactylos carnosus]
MIWLLNGELVQNGGLLLKMFNVTNNQSGVLVYSCENLLGGKSEENAQCYSATFCAGSGEYTGRWSKWIIVTACEMKTKSSCKGEEIMERLCKATNKTRELGKSSKQLNFSCSFFDGYSTKKITSCGLGLVGRHGVNVVKPAISKENFVADAVQDSVDLVFVRERGILNNWLSAAKKLVDVRRKEDTASFMEHGYQSGVQLTVNGLTGRRGNVTLFVVKDE